MKVVITYLALDDLRERIYACEAIGIEHNVLTAYHGEELYRFALSEIRSLVSVSTGEVMQLREFVELLALQKSTAEVQRQ